VTGSSAATGGGGGTGGAATASIALIAAHAVAATATAVGGAGAAGAGTALATATATGQTGTVGVQASTGQPAGAHITSVLADASTGFARPITATATATAEAKISGTAPTFIAAGQAVAFATGAPASASTTPIFTHNPAIAAAAGPGPLFLADAELGGGYAVAGGGSETATSGFAITVALNAADLTKDLVLGFFGGTSVGAGVTGVSLDILANGVDTLHSFATGALAAAFFDNKPLDLGPLSGSAYAGGSLNLDVTLKVTADAASAGFYGGVIVTG
jgi:hypothetical protein